MGYKVLRKATVTCINKLFRLEIQEKLDFELPTENPEQVDFPLEKPQY